MENQGLNQLPEADSLPDGFVDSPSKPLAPQTPNSDTEKVQKIDYKDELVSNDSDATTGGTGKTQKPRTFPVPLSETDGPEESVNSVEGGLVMPVSEAAFGEVKGEINEEIQSTERSVDRALSTSSTPLTEISSPESADLLQNKKPEIAETKRKNPKRGFILEKEVLELSLGYQHVLAERDAAIAVRDKLESLCRELQRQNKMLMDECKRVSAEGQNLRLDLSTKFQDAIQEVSIKLEEQKNESLSQLKENEMLRTKLKQLADQYALSEQQYSQMLKQKSLELQLSELRIKQHEEKLSLEQAQMKEYAEQVSQLLATEKNLRLQLTTDSEKFQQFQDALLKSNEVFETFKQEIEKMSKSIKELKKENVFLRNKCEKSDITLIELVEERERLKKQLEKTRNEKEKLESLCRSLQAERKQSSIGSGSADSVAALLPQTILPS